MQNETTALAGGLTAALAGGLTAPPLKRESETPLLDEIQMRISKVLNQLRSLKTRVNNITVHLVGQAQNKPSGETKEFGDDFYSIISCSLNNMEEEIGGINDNLNRL